jgi:hypothetical protein
MYQNMIASSVLYLIIHSYAMIPRFACVPLNVEPQKQHTAAAASELPRSELFTTQDKTVES